MVIKRLNSQVRVHVGRRIKIFRQLAGYSQEKIAGRIDVTYQQLQKYEQGIDNISAERLWELSQLFNIPITSFFEDLDLSHPQLFDLSVFASEKYTEEVFKMVNVYCRIKNKKTREAFYNLLKTHVLYGNEKKGDKDEITS